MKPALAALTVLFTVAFSLMNFTFQEQQNGAFISINSAELNFGTLKHNVPAERKVIIKNTGNQALIINDCKGSCGCTTPQCPKTPIAPNESDTLTIKYDSKSLGNFSKTVTIKSNAINHVLYIKIKGTVTE